jgi:phage shock protein A
MAESVFDRVRRICSATVEDAVDRMERSGGDAVMREAIREVDRAIDEVRGAHENAVARRLQAARQQKMVKERIAQLGEKARFAVAEGRDDLAEAALARQIDFEAEVGRFDTVQAQSTDEEARLEDSLAALRTRKQQMSEALSAWEQSCRDASVGGDGPGQTDRNVDRKVERAEQAFDRAMNGAGGVNFTRADAETINAVAELDGLQKSATVADRLAALKASVNKAA